MADKEATLLIRLKDEVSQGLGALAGQIAKVGAAFAALKIFVIDAIKSYAEQEQSVNRLNVALKNQGIYSDQLSKDIQKYAGQLQKTTAFSDEEIISAQALMVTYGMQGIQLKKSTQAALDLSTALGVDLHTASMLLGKAFQGQTETLTRYGIKIDEAIPSSEKFEAVIGKINDRFGGAAQANLDTYAGKIKNLGNQFDEFKESIGRAIVPLLGASMDVIGEFADKITAALGNEEAQASLLQRNLDNLQSQRQTIIDQATLEGTLRDANTQLMILEYDTEIAKIQALQEAEAMADQQSLLNAQVNGATREQLWAQSRKNREAGYKAFLANEATLAAEEKKNRDEGYKAYLANEKSMEEFDKKMAEEKINTARNSLNMIASLSMAKNKELAAIGKAAAIALAIMDTYAGANKAMAQLGAFGPPVAALIVAAGMANVARIAGVELAEGGLVMPRSGGTVATLGEAGQPEIVIPLGDSRTNQVLSDSGMGSTNIVINVGTLLGTENNVRELAMMIDRELFTLRRNNESVALGAL